MNRLPLLVCSVGFALSSYAASAAPVDVEPGEIKWSVTPTLKPRSTKPLVYEIHQKQLKPYDFTATIEKDGLVKLDLSKVPPYQLVVDYLAKCPDGHIPVFKQPKIVRKDTATTVSFTTTVLVENLIYLTDDKCASLTSGSVDLIAKVKGSPPQTSTIKVVLLP